MELKKFNYKRIYTDENVKQSNAIIHRTMRIMFEKYMYDIENRNKDSKVFKHFLNHKNDEYLESFCPAEQVRDFIATMTDRYYNEEVKQYMLPWKGWPTLIWFFALLQTKWIKVFLWLSFYDGLIYVEPTENESTGGSAWILKSHLKWKCYPQRSLNIQIGKKLLRLQSYPKS